MGDVDWHVSVDADQGIVGDIFLATTLYPHIYFYFFKINSSYQNTFDLRGRRTALQVSKRKICSPNEMLTKKSFKNKFLVFFDKKKELGTGSSVTIKHTTRTHTNAPGGKELKRIKVDVADQEQASRTVLSKCIRQRGFACSS